MEIRLKINKPRPHFYLIPEFVWGHKSGFYDSDGDCNGAEDCVWTELYVNSRIINSHFSIMGDDGIFEGCIRVANKPEGIYRISSNDKETAIKIAYFLWKQCDAEFLDKDQESLVKGWNKEK